MLKNIVLSSRFATKGTVARSLIAGLPSRPTATFVTVSPLFKLGAKNLLDKNSNLIASCSHFSSTAFVNETATKTKKKSSTTKPKEKAATKPKPKKEKAKAKAKEGKKFKPPPRNISPFALYVKENTQRIKQELLDKNGELDGKLDATAVAPQAAAEYKNLSEHDRGELYERAKAISEEQKERYNDWIANLSIEDIKLRNAYVRSVTRNNSKKKKTYIRHEDAPKRPSNAYIQFISAVTGDPRREQDLIGNTESSKEKWLKLSQVWRGMSESEKRPYQEQWEADKEAYKREYEAYLNRHS